MGKKISERITLKKAVSVVEDASAEETASPAPVPATAPVPVDLAASNPVLPLVIDNASSSNVLPTPSAGGRISRKHVDLKRKVIDGNETYDSYTVAVKRRKDALGELEKSSLITTSMKRPCTAPSFDEALPVILPRTTQVKTVDNKKSKSNDEPLKAPLSIENKPSSAFEITIRPLLGDNFCVSIPADSSVYDLKEIVYNKVWILPERQLLSCSSMPEIDFAHEEAFLEDLNLPRNCTINLSFKAASGMQSIANFIFSDDDESVVYEILLPASALQNGQLKVEDEDNLEELAELSIDKHENNDQSLFNDSTEEIEELEALRIERITSADVFPKSPLSTSALQSSSAMEQPKAKNDRCYFCTIKCRPALRFECKCGNTFCQQHRYYDAHKCSFDVRGHDLSLLSQSFAKVVKPKIDQLVIYRALRRVLIGQGTGTDDPSITNRSYSSTGPFVMTEYEKDSQSANATPEIGADSVYYDANEQSALISDTAASAWPRSSVWSSAARNYLSLTPSVPPLSESETLTTTAADDDNSYMGHLRAQANMPGRFLSGVDLDAYIPGVVRNTGPGGGGDSGRAATSSGKGRLYSLGEPLLEESLPNGRKESLFPAIHGPVARRDSLTAYTFWCMFGLMMMLGVMVCFVYPSALRDRILRSSTLYRAIVDSGWLLAMCSGMGIVISVIWVILVRYFTAPLIKMMTVFVPLAAGSVGVWAFFEWMRAESSSWLLIILSTAAFSAAGFFYFYIRQKGETIKSTIAIVSLSGEILSDNPGIYMASSVLLVTYVVFVAVWLVFFTHILLLGHAESLPDDSLIRVWRLSAWSYLLQAYFLAMLVWTSLIFSYVQKCMIGTIVGRWYFFRDESGGFRQSMVHAKDALYRSTTVLFGQICLAALVMSSVRISRSIVKAYHQISKLASGSLIQSLFKGVSMCFGFVERLLEHVTDLAIYYCSLTGESFWTSGRSVVKIFRRNMLLGFTTDLTAQLILLMSTSVIAGVVGLSSYSFVSHSLHSYYGLSTALLFSLVVWYILRFFTNIISDTIDATFICFAIDLDIEKLHSPTIHQTFSHRVGSSV